MDNFMDALYSHAQDTQVIRYLQTPRYHQAVDGLEEGWAAFRSDLTEGQRGTLDVLLSREKDVGLLEDEASFAAGLSIGLDLGRL